MTETAKENFEIWWREFTNLAIARDLNVDSSRDDYGEYFLANFTPEEAIDIEFSDPE